MSLIWSFCESGRGTSCIRRVRSAYKVSRYSQKGKYQQEICKKGFQQLSKEGLARVAVHICLNLNLNLKLDSTMHILSMPFDLLLTKYSTTFWIQRAVSTMSWRHREPKKDVLRKIIFSWYCNFIHNKSLSKIVQFIDQQLLFLFA